MISSIEHAHIETKVPRTWPYSKGHKQNSIDYEYGTTRLSSLSTHQMVIIPSEVAKNCRASPRLRGAWPQLQCHGIEPWNPHVNALGCVVELRGSPPCLYRLFTDARNIGAKLVAPQIGPVTKVWVRGHGTNQICNPIRPHVAASTRSHCSSINHNNWIQKSLLIWLWECIDY